MFGVLVKLLTVLKSVVSSIFVKKKLLNYVAMCNWFVISFPLMSRD